MSFYVGIDPSTKTGVVVIDQEGKVIFQKELHLQTGIRSTDEELKLYGEEIAKFVPPDSNVCIEDFSYGSQGQGVSTQYGVGFSIRFALIKKGVKFIKPTPSQVKKFATGKGNSKKDAMVLPIFRHWGFEHKSDNVRDAFVLAQIAKGLGTYKADLLSGEFPKYQIEVLGALEAKEEEHPR